MIEKITKKIVFKVIKERFINDRKINQKNCI